MVGASHWSSEGFKLYTYVTFTHHLSPYSSVVRASHWSSEGYRLYTFTLSGLRNGCDWSEIGYRLWYFKNFHLYNHVTFAVKCLLLLCLALKHALQMRSFCEPLLSYLTPRQRSWWYPLDLYPWHRRRKTLPASYSSRSRVYHSGPSGVILHCVLLFFWERKLKLESERHWIGTLGDLWKTRMGTVRWLRVHFQCCVFSTYVYTRRVLRTCKLVHWRVLSTRTLNVEKLRVMTSTLFLGKVPVTRELSLSYLNELLQ